MIKTVKMNAVYLKSDHGKAKNYIKKVNVVGKNEVNLEFTQVIGEVYPFKDSDVQEAMKLVAMPFVSKLMKAGKTEQEILDWVQENIGSDGIDLTITSENDAK